MTAQNVLTMDAPAYAKARARAIRPTPLGLPTSIPPPLSDMTPEEHAALVEARNPKRAGEMSAAEYAKARGDLIRENRK